MLVLGIDPGTAITGFGLVRETDSGDLEAVKYGTFLTPASFQKNGL
jgi:crossover junction endodeoxyribonuclease RuvC